MNEIKYEIKTKYYLLRTEWKKKYVAFICEDKNDMRI